MLVPRYAVSPIRSSVGPLVVSEGSPNCDVTYERTHVVLNIRLPCFSWPNAVSPDTSTKRYGCSQVLLLVRSTRTGEPVEGLSISPILPIPSVLSSVGVHTECIAFIGCVAPHSFPCPLLVLSLFSLLRGLGVLVVEGHLKLTS